MYISSYLSLFSLVKSLPMGCSHITCFINKLVVSYGFMENRDGARGPDRPDLKVFFFILKTY